MVGKEAGQVALRPRPRPRRGDAPAFLSICHVLEFEPIYREEAKGRQVASLKQGAKAPSGINDTEREGRSRSFMARDAAASPGRPGRVFPYKRRYGAPGAKFGTF